MANQKNKRDKFLTTMNQLGHLLNRSPSSNNAGQVRPLASASPSQASTSSLHSVANTGIQHETTSSTVSSSISSFNTSILSENTAKNNVKVIQRGTTSLSAAPVGHPNTALSSGKPVNDTVQIALNGAFELLKIAKDSVDTLPGLKAVLGGIVAVINVCKNTSGNYEEMERVLNNIALLKSTLDRNLDGHTSSTMQVIDDLKTSLDSECRKLEAMHEQGYLVRMAQNNTDASELITSCRAIDDAVRRFQLELFLAVERNVAAMLQHATLEKLPRARDAAYRAAIKLDNISRGPCTKGTRVDVIKQVMAWATETDTHKSTPIYWLNGLAGMGKTTIAYTICQELQMANLPFTSFFCSRQLDTRNSELLVTTLCRDLAQMTSSYAHMLSRVMQQALNADIVTANLPTQIQELLVTPWRDSLAGRRGQRSPIVIVDALDENSGGTDFLRELISAAGDGNLVGLKFFVTSRPHPDIVQMCRSFPPDSVCTLHDIDPVNVQPDILKFLQEKLPELKDSQQLLEVSQQAGGLFIYAATVVRFISPSDVSVSCAEKLKLLKQLLTSWPSPELSGEQLLVDQLYKQILVAAFGHHSLRSGRLNILHTALCAVVQPTISVLAGLTEMDEETVQETVNSLHAVLFLSRNDNSVYWYHTSFPDFVFSQAHARVTDKINVFCDQIDRHTLIASQCFSLLAKSLHFNMCGLESSYIFDVDVPGLDERVQQKFTPVIHYASRYWAKHLLLGAGPASSLAHELNNFLYKKLLFWMEAMNLIGAKFECYSLLQDVEQWLRKGINSANSTALALYVQDAADFSMSFAASPMAKSTPHLYISALAACNPDSSVWSIWQHYFPHIPSMVLPHDQITLPLIRILTNRPVSYMALSPNGDRIITASDNFVLVWNAKTTEQLGELNGHSDSVWSVAFSPSGDKIVSGSEDQSVCVWDSKTGKQQKVLNGHTDAVRSVAFSPNGDRIISGSLDNSVQIWDANTGRQLKKLICHSEGVLFVAFSPSGEEIVSGSNDNSVQVWNAKTGKPLKRLKHHHDAVLSVVFSSDGSKLVSGSLDKSVRVWDVKTGKQLKKLNGHTDAVLSVTFSPNGDKIVSGSLDCSVRVWDTNTGEQLRELIGHSDAVLSVAFSPSGEQFVSGSEDCSVWVWNAKMSKQRRELNGHNDAILSVAFSPDGVQIVSGSDDCSVRIWDAKTGRQLRKLIGHSSAVLSVGFSPSGKQILSGSADYSVQVWDTNTGERLWKLDGHDNTVRSVVFSPDGSQIVSGSNDNSIWMWDFNTGQQLKVFNGHTDAVLSVAFSPGSELIVSGSLDNSVRVWSVETGKQLKKLNGHSDAVLSVAFSHEGTKIASSSLDHSVQVWNASTGDQLQMLTGHTGAVLSIIFLPGGENIVSGSKDYSVRIWDIKTGRQLHYLYGHSDIVWSVAFSPNGDQFVSGSQDCSIRVWNAPQVYKLPGLPLHNIVDSAVQSWEDMILDTAWITDQDGWILSKGTDRLIWLPPTIHDVLHPPHSHLIISRQLRGLARVSFKRSKLGSLWQNCYSP